MDAALDVSSAGSLPYGSHTYAKNGVDTATVTVDDGSDSGSASFPITVGGPKGGSIGDESVYLPAIFAVGQAVTE